MAPGRSQPFLTEANTGAGLTSDQIEKILKVAHAEVDKPDIVDCSMLVELAEALSKLITETSMRGV